MTIALLAALLVQTEDRKTVFYKITGGGHTWPGTKVPAERVLGVASRDINASEAIREFFSRHRLPERK